MADCKKVHEPIRLSTGVASPTQTSIIAVGCATYVGAIAVLDRTIFADLRRVASAFRG